MRHIGKEEEEVEAQVMREMKVEVNEDEEKGERDKTMLGSSESPLADDRDGQGQASKRRRKLWKRGKRAMM